MEDENKTKDQLIQELIKMRKKIVDLEEITIEGKQAKTELKESEKKYKDLVEETPIGIANIGITGKVIYINKRLEKISGYSRGEVVAKNVFKLGLFSNEMLKILKERLKVRFRGGSVQQRREIRFKCKDGKWIWIEITAMLIKKWGILSSLQITIQDITERKKTEEELKDSEERLKILFDYAPDAYYISDLKGNFVDGNKAAERVIGYKKEELIGKNFLKLKLLSVRDIPKAAKLLAKNLRRLPTGPDEFILNRKDNSKVTVEISTYPVKIKGKALALGLARDITERKQLEEELLVKNLVFEESITANSTSDNEGILTYVNSAFIKIFGYESKEEAVGKPISDFLKFEDEAINIITALNESGVWEGEYTGLRKDRSTFIAYGLATTIKDRSGNSVGYQSAVLDISDRKRMEKILRESEEKYSSVVENSKDGIIVLQKGIIKFFNQAILNLTGYNLEELIDKEFEPFLLSPEYSKLIMDRYQARLAGKETPSVYEIEIIRKDGISVPVEVSNTTITYGGEKATLSFIRNITERKQAMEEIEKLAKFPTENPNPVLRISKDGTVLFHNYASESLLRKWHYKEGKPLQDRWSQFVLDALEDNDIKSAETEIGDKVISLTFAPITEKDFVNVYGLDITERKQAEKSLQESEAKYRAVLEQSADNIFLVDLENKKILESNVSLSNLLGYSVDEMKKLTIYDFIARPKDEIKKKLKQLQKEDKTVIRERKYLRKDGSLVDVEMVRNLITFGNKKVLCVVSRDISERKQSVEKLKKTMDATIDTMSNMIGAKDPYTAGHQQRVSQLATAIAKELHLPPDKIEGIRIASLIHDIGKIGLPTEILSKPSKLTDIEFSLIKNHSQIGYDILKSIDFPFPIAQIILQHHEKIDGSGYPNKLKGDEILLEAKIIGVADVVEAMSSFRPYRPALGIDVALEEISQNRGILYDPEVVGVCLKLFKEKSFKFE